MFDFVRFGKRLLCVLKSIQLVVNNRGYCEDVCKFSLKSK